MSGSQAERRLTDNPFHVLGLRPDCVRADVEREGQKLIAMLELGLSAARTYASPLGVHERSAEQVREAMAELRDPDRRLIHELWAGLPVPATPATSEPEPVAKGPSDEPRADRGFVLLGFESGSAGR
jgi:hypothetical protein